MLTRKKVSIERRPIREVGRTLISLVIAIVVAFPLTLLGLKVAPMVGLIPSFGVFVGIAIGLIAGAVHGGKFLTSTYLLALALCCWIFGFTSLVPIFHFIPQCNGVTMQIGETCDSYVNGALRNSFTYLGDDRDMGLIFWGSVLFLPFLMSGLASLIGNLFPSEISRVRRSVVIAIIFSVVFVSFLPKVIRLYMLWRV